MTDSIRLKKIIEESGLKIAAFLDAMGIRNYQTLWNKVEGESEFTAREISILSGMLHLSVADRDAIFFAK